MSRMDGQRENSSRPQTQFAGAIKNSNDLMGLSAPARVYIHVHVYEYYFQTSSLKQLGQSKLNFMWSLLGTKVMLRPKPFIPWYI